MTTVAARALAVAGATFSFAMLRWFLARDRHEAFTVSVFDNETTIEEDEEIISALKEFFDSNTIAIGHDGVTSWSVP